MPLHNRDPATYAHMLLRRVGTERSPPLCRAGTTFFFNGFVFGRGGGIIVDSPLVGYLIGHGGHMLPWPAVPGSLFFVSLAESGSRRTPTVDTMMMEC